MILLGHIMGVPVEEFLIPWAGGMGAGTLIVLASGIGALRYRKTSTLSDRDG